MIADRDRDRQAGRDQSWVMLLGPRAEPKPLQGQLGKALAAWGKQQWAKCRARVRDTVGLRMEIDG